ncbi:response regulator [Alteromonas sp. KUL106]|uniref:response regulator n=1 Tax=Alteromonas sp. KUL106 TaxID=2480799 RepID=UPI0027E3D28A|nr:response regulator [Alteromonas sp. KUL106]
MVEDNATARTALRGHLMSIANLEVSSFATGVELKAALKKQHFELVLMDYHLGEGKNGVEWIQNLREAGFIRPSTGIIFLTSDRSPQIIGRIMDLQPDVLLIKPYTIASLTRQVKHYLTYRDFIKNALHALDSKQPDRAVSIIRAKIKEGIPPRLVGDIRKLYARLLVECGEIRSALTIYEDVLTRSEKVLWAQWGKIKCQYVSGEWPECKNFLGNMVNSSLARDKAFEWLASISFEQNAFEDVEKYLNEINFSELSLPAAKLKTIAFQKQDKVIEAIDLLQKKRAIHRSAKDRFIDFTFELAEFYLFLAEESPETNRAESLSQARKLVGIAGRSQGDPQILQKRDYLLAFGAVIDNDLEKAAHLLEGDYIDNYLRTEPSILVIAAKVHHGLGDERKAGELLLMAKQKNVELQAISEQVMNDELIFSGGERLGLNHEQAVLINETGTQLFIEGSFTSAMKHFYDAFHLSPETPAFGLNLLQCMIEADTGVYRKFNLKQLIAKITTMTLNETNKSRLEQLILSAQERSM